MAQHSNDPNPLVTHIYTADPSAHLVNDRIYIYPSHDIETGAQANDMGDHFDMRDYHVLSMDSIPGKVTDHGVALDIKNIPWAKRQLWAPDAAFANNKYYLFFPAKDKDDVFRIGVATSSKPEGPFVAEKNYINGTYSIDPAIFKDADNEHYLYFGGIWGGQLQNWSEGKYNSSNAQPAPDEPAIGPRIAKLTKDMLSLAEPVRTITILDEQGKPLLSKDNSRRFFEACWVHKFNNKYYLSYSTGDTHFICYATGDSPYGPFTYKGVVLKPVIGWTNHHSIVEFKGQWYIFYHDSTLSGGKTHLRCVKVRKLNHLTDGSIEAIDPYK